MQIGMVGLGRMGANIVRRLMRADHECVVYDANAEAVQGLVDEGALGALSLAELVRQLHTPRAIWLMLPAVAVDPLLAELAPLLQPGDMLIDGGNSHYQDDIRRAAQLQERGIHYLDVGTSGGIWGLERGYCLMIGGELPIVQALDPIFRALARGVEAAPRVPGRMTKGSTAEWGYLHCGPSGAGHFVKLVHNGIECGLMAAYAEGLNILKYADVGLQPAAADAEIAPLRHPERYQYNFSLADVAEVWRRGSVVSSWLLDLIAHALLADPTLANFSGRVADSGEGRWVVLAAIDEGVPAPVISAALYTRFSSRGNDAFADKLMSAMRYEFGGHVEQDGGNSHEYAPLRG
jgi:6-phosphogluconate dehydrogenase